MESGVARWLTAVTNVCGGQTLTGFAGFRMGDHRGSLQRILANLFPMYQILLPP